MATLTEAAYYTRTGVKWGVVALVGLMVGRIFFGALIAWWKATHPPPPPPPTVGFGKLPAIQFPDTIQPDLEYSLETVSGTTPVLNDQTAVYFMPIKKANLLALERATEKAANLGFVFNPKKISEEVYQWTKTQPLASSLEINIITGNFEIEVNWQTDPGFLKKKQLPNQTQAAKEISGLLRQARLIPIDLVEGRQEIAYFKVVGNKYVKTVSLSEADFVKLSMFRKPIGEDQLLAVTPESENGIVQVMFSGSTDSGERIVSLIYNYFPVDYLNFQTYPLKASSQAWEELKSGQGFVAAVDDGVEQVIVRRVKLAYFDSFKPQNYLQPVYVFEGDNGFIGYVGAVDEEWIQENPYSQPVN